MRELPVGYPCLNRFPLVHLLLALLLLSPCSELALPCGASGIVVQRAATLVTVEASLAVHLDRVAVVLRGSRLLTRAFQGKPKLRPLAWSFTRERASS